MSANESVAKRGIDLLRDPQLNKSTAFTEAERQALGLTGLLPAGVDSLETQVQRALQQLGQKPTDLERYIYLIQLLDTDETLFYKLLMSDAARFLPIVYAPTVGEACLKFGHIFRRPRGMYVSLKHKGRVQDVLRNWPARMCASSAPRPASVSSAWAIRGPTAWASPSASSSSTRPALPCRRNTCCPCTSTSARTTRSCSTIRCTWACASRASSPAELDEFVEEFVQAVQEVFPGCCIHFEDWAGVDAMRLLARYRDRVCCLQRRHPGHGRHGLAGILGALRMTGGELRDQRVCSWGPARPAIGIANLIALTMTLEGLTEDQARRRISLFDLNGLLEPSRTDLFDFQKPYAHPHKPSRDFVAVIESLSRQRSSGSAPRARPSAGRSSRRWPTSTGGQSYSPCRTRPITRNARPRRPTAGPTGGPCTRPECPSHRCVSAARPSCRDRATTCTSSRPSGWQSLPRGPASDRRDVRGRGAGRWPTR